MLPIVNAVQDVFGFVTVFLFAFAASVHAFYVLGQSGEMQTLYNDILTVYRLAVLGDFQLDELEDQTQEGLRFAVHMFFFFVTAAISIVLMNLLIGVLGSNYDRFADQGEELFMRARADLLSEYLASPWWQWWMDLDDAFTNNYIVVASKDEKRNDEENHSLRGHIDRTVSNVVQRVKALEEKMTTRHSALEVSLERTMQSLLSHMQALDEKLSSESIPRDYSVYSEKNSMRAH